MRTGIYIEKPTTVTISATAPQDARVQLRRFRPATRVADARAQLRDPEAVGTHQLDAGIYLIVSNSSMQIEGDNVTTAVVANDKEGWPDPPAGVVGLVSDATSTTLQAIQDFFAVTKGIDIGDPPPQPVSPAKPGTSKVTDEPDGL